MGIEPTSKAWEAFVLPLNYTRSAPDSTTEPLHAAQVNAVAGLLPQGVLSPRPAPIAIAEAVLP
jgi:hypothetical protein